MRWFVKDGKGQGSAHASEAAARGMYESAVARAEPGEKVSMHLCAHNLEGPEPPDQWYDCRQDHRAQYEETIIEPIVTPA
jgi:hypothetical protein